VVGWPVARGDVRICWRRRSAFAGAGVGGACGALVTEVDVVFGGEVEEVLSLLVSGGEAVKQPAEQECRQENLLDHHHAASEVLV
jgi:hypothetical protein